MINPRVALLGAALAALPLTVNAAPPPAEQLVVYDAAGHPLGVLMPFANRPEATQFVDPVAQFIHEMDAMMPDPAALFAQQTAMMRQMSELMLSSIGNGRGSCGRIVTYSFSGDNPQPQVAVRQVGEACGEAIPPGNRSLPVRQPQQVLPEGSRLIQVDYRHPSQAPKELHG